MSENELKEMLFAFLQGSRETIRVEGIGELTREAAEARLRELIPTKIKVSAVCNLSFSAVVAAPHVRFDGWSEYFSRLAAEEFGLGRVIARHFRDDNEFDIPVSIGRHLHVNRPTESAERGGRELETPRARQVFEQYVKAIARAAGNKLPLDLLIEFHGHRRHEAIEIATAGVDVSIAKRLVSSFGSNEVNAGALPELRIEPLHKLHFSARRAKLIGVMHETVARRAVHIEIPRTLRRPEENRLRAWSLLRPLLECLLALTKDMTHQQNDSPN
jgi:hypothetical protein